MTEEPWTKRYIIIGSTRCPFCIHTIDYCEARMFEYIFLDYTENEGTLEEYKKFHDHETIPIILQNDVKTGLTKKIGGYSEFIEIVTERYKKLT